MTSRGVWHDGVFTWKIILPAPLSMGWRWRNNERSGWEPFEWTIELHCGELRHSDHMSTCCACGYKHEKPPYPPERWAFYWYPMEPSIRALQQWERWRRHREVTESYEREQHLK
jgi:hypothetical protein